MLDWGTILPGIAACITSVGGIVVGVMAVRRSSPRERRDAARGVVERAINPDDDADDDVLAAIEALREQLKRKDRT